VRRGHEDSGQRRAMVTADGSTMVRGRLERMLPHFASRGEGARDASGDGERDGPLSAGAVEWETDDADSRMAVGRREHGVVSPAQRLAVLRAAVAIT
jgi:hypothetical protein